MVSCRHLSLDEMETVRRKQVKQADHRSSRAALELSEKILSVSLLGDQIKSEPLTISWLAEYAEGNKRTLRDLDAEFFDLMSEMVGEISEHKTLDEGDDHSLSVVLANFKPTNPVDLKILRYFFEHKGALGTIGFFRDLYHEDVDSVVKALSRGEKGSLRASSTVILRRVYADSLSRGDFIVNLPSEILMEFYGEPSPEAYEDKVKIGDPRR